MSSDHTPFLIVVSAPSGCGKTSILKRLLKDDDKLSFSISVTSRPPRPGEVDGRDYIFVSEEDFKTRLLQGEFLEYARVHGNYYGTSRSYVEELLSAGYDVVLDIDVQGMIQLEESWQADFASVFILPPSYAELEHRLVSRGTDSPSDIKKRLVNAGGEIEYGSRYRYLLVNDQLDIAVSQLKSVISAERSRASRNDRLMKKVAEGFLLAKGG